MKWVSHYNFMDKYIDDFYKNILKDNFILGSYQGFVSAHGDKFYSEKSEYDKRSIGFAVGVMIGMIISYTRNYRTEYENNYFDNNWYWSKFDEIVSNNSQLVNKYNELWKSYEDTGNL